MRAKRQLLCFPVASALSPLLSKSFPLVSAAKRPCAVMMSAHADDAAAGKRVRLSAAFRETDVAAARELTDGVGLRAAGGGADDPVILPFVGFGTYKLGRDVARSATLQALVRGYRCVDTAFIYGGETTERQVGLAIQDAVDQNILENGRRDLFVVTKHWRKYHGYDETKECLRLSLKRLQLDYVDLWLMHWPGPAYNTMSRRKDLIEKHGPWHYAVHSERDMPRIRAETWRAMEDAVRSGQARAIGVCNCTVRHLEHLKRTATLWPPAVNQIECHPLFPQKELVEYCRKEGIVVQAYASLGGQDAGKKFWSALYPPPSKRGRSTHEPVTRLSNTPPVLRLAREKHRTSAQVLLRWALDKNLTVIPKTATGERMAENADVLDFSLSAAEVNALESDLRRALAAVAEKEDGDFAAMARLCWRNDPLRDLLFN